jgi:predicted DNA-binding WGR domain protein
MHTLIKRRDPARRMARFYQLSLQGVLDAEGVRVALLREWGRIGSPGTVRAEAYDTIEAAESAARALEARKRRRGYK